MITSNFILIGQLSWLIGKFSFMVEKSTRTNERNYAQKAANNRKPAQTKKVYFSLSISWVKLAPISLE